MPFEFTGALPPRLDAPSSFASFAFNSTADSKQNTQTSVPLFKIIPAPPVNSGLTRPLPQPRAISDDFGVVPPPSAKNPLEKALVRALRDRPAIWGRSDIAGDEVMKGVLKGYEDFDIRTVLAGLRRVEETHPDVVRFTLALFDSAVQSRMPMKPSGAQVPTIPINAIDPAPSEQVLGAPQAPVPSDSTTHLASTTQIYDSDPVRFPRHHPRIGSLVEALAAKILRGAVVTYPEGAKVLAGHVVDLYYKGLSQGDVVAALLTLLGRPDDIGEVPSVATYADDGLDALESQYEQKKEEMDKELLEGEGQDDEDVEDAMDENANFKADCTAQLPPPAWRPFRFLELPAEMRNLIYGLLLAPDGHIGLLKLQCTAEDRHLKDVVFPDARLRFTCDAEHYILSGCSPQILAVCQQIYGEAKQIMYEENTVCATVAIWTGVLVLNKCLLPDSMLRRLTSLLLACDAAESSTMDSEWFTQLPWKQLQDLTSLRNLRLSLIERESQNDTTRSKKFILEHILERIPASCNVTFVSREGFEDTYVQEVIDETQAQMARRRHVMNVDDVHEVEGRVLEALAKQCMHKQGRKSGHERDYRFPDRSIATVIGKLMPLTKISDVDPHLVLGGTGGRWR